jgi:hypothetical protein
MKQQTLAPPAARLGDPMAEGASSEIGAERVSGTRGAGTPASSQSQGSRKVTDGRHWCCAAAAPDTSQERVSPEKAAAQHERCIKRRDNAVKCKHIQHRLQLPK